MTQRFLKILFILLFVFCYTNAQRSSTVTKKREKTSIAAIPIINYNRTQGFIAGALVSYYYKVNKKDTISPTSNTGIFGMYTAKKSYMVLGFTKLYFARDIWRVTAAAGTMDINFQFYLEEPVASTGKFYDYSSKANLFVLQVQRNIFRRIYLGPTGSFVKSTTTFGLPCESGEDSVSISQLNNIGYIISNDTRDHVQNPVRGMFLNFKNQFYRDWVNSDYEFVRYIVSYNQFYKFSKKDDTQVMAMRATFNIATGDVPFEGQTVVGGDDIRGYSQGRYRNDQVYTLQAEYRWNFYKRWGLVAFAGLASAVEKFADIPDELILPGAGAGIRFKMLPTEKVNIGIDAGVGRDDYSITFRIGESFGR
jgi:outer membrane protein assembly factor BamA